VRTLFRAVLVSILALSLAYSPVTGSVSRVVGTVILADQAEIGAAEATSGTTVFAGDNLLTRQSGSLRLRVGSGQVYLLAGTNAMLGAEGDVIRAAVARGTLGFSSSEPIEVLASEVTVRPKTKSLTHGRVTVLGANELVVTSYRGELEVLLGNETATIREGNSYRVLVDAENGRNDDDEDARRNRLLVLWLGIAGIAAVTAYAIWKAAASPKTP